MKAIFNGLLAGLLLSAAQALAAPAFLQGGEPELLTPAEAYRASVSATGPSI